MNCNLLYKVKKLCTDHNISVTELAREIGLSHSTILKWDKFTPTTDKISSVADYFNVSVDYLLGRTDITSPIDQALADPDLITIQRLRSNLSVRDREKMMQMMKIQFSEDFPQEDNNDI